MKISVYCLVFLSGFFLQTGKAQTPTPIVVMEENLAETEFQDIPFAVVEEAPLFPGCEDLKSNWERKECFSKNVQDFLSGNFNVAVSQGLGLTGLNRIFARFRIDPNGEVHVLGIRAPHPDLSQEIESVLKLLPKMVPAKQRGKNVGIIYTLSFTFKT